MAKPRKMREWMINGVRCYSEKKALEEAQKIGLAKLPKPVREEWLAEVRKGGINKRQRFSTKAAAQVFIDKVSTEINETGRAVDFRKLRTSTVGKLLKRYEEEYAKYHRGYEKSEKWRIKSLVERLGSKPAITLNKAQTIIDYVRDREHLSPKPMKSAGEGALAKWKAENFEKGKERVSRGSVLRELVILSTVIETASTIWDLPLKHGDDNAVKIAKKRLLLKEPPARDRRLSRKEEICLLNVAAGYGHGKKKRGMYAHLIILFLELAKRRGEIGQLRWENVDWEEQEAWVGLTKNGYPQRFPLSMPAMEALDALREITGKSTSGRVIGDYKNEAMTRAMGRICARAGLEDLRLHDLRRESASRFAARGFSIPEIQLMTGHRGFEVMKRYLQPTPAEVRARMDAWTAIEKAKKEALAIEPSDAI